MEQDSNGLGLCSLFMKDVAEIKPFGVKVYLDYILLGSNYRTMFIQTIVDDVAYTRGKLMKMQTRFVVAIES